MARILRPPVMHFLRVLIPDHHQLPLRCVFPEVFWRKRELIVETTGERREERDAENSNRALQKSLCASRQLAGKSDKTLHDPKLHESDPTVNFIPTGINFNFWLL